VPIDQPWTREEEPVTLEQPGGLVTIVEGSSFMLSERSGDILPGGPSGLFVLDVRAVSSWQLRVDGRPLEALSVSVTEPYAATFVSRLTRLGGHIDSTLLAIRRRWVGSGMRENVELRNYSSEPATISIQLDVASDLADVFDVKAGQPALGTGHKQHGDALHTSAEHDGVRRRVDVTERGARTAGAVGAHGMSWNVTLPAQGTWRTCLEVSVTVGEHDVPLQYRCGEPPAHSRPSLRLAGWRRHAPHLTATDGRLAHAIDRAVDDIGSLIIEDPRHPESPVVAAGAPWFMALFGRDSLLTSYMSLIVDPALAVGVAQTLARLQGVREDMATEEQPGRILHEVRFGSTGGTDLDGGHIYYGTADATPLFVMLVGELSRWGVQRNVVDALLPHVDRALEWIDRYGDRDGDGYVEYERLNPEGLANQGWKDSWDGISALDGTLAAPPVALAEVQGYVYAAYLARAELATERGDELTARHYELKAARLRTNFNRDFWLDDHGWYAVALDGAKNPVDALASNMGHCLWSGIIDEAHAPSVAAHLTSTEMLSGWGVRTLATGIARYNPLSYHNGSVWPHDSAIVAAGLMRYGFVDAAATIIDALLDAATANGGRLPELYAGLDRADLPVPVAYPTSCSPQAWSSAAPLLMLRTLLRLEPDMAAGRFVVDPIPGVDCLGDVEIVFAGARIRIGRGADGDVDVSGLPAGVAVATEPPRARAGRVSGC
jgi:glycogen debranching enzyme